MFQDSEKFHGSSEASQQQQQMEDSWDEKCQYLLEELPESLERMGRKLNETKNQHADLKLKITILREDIALDGGKSRILMELKQKVQELVGDGASIAKSHILHCAAHFLEPMLIDTILSLVPDNQRCALVNTLDFLGLTPLMSAASPARKCRSLTAQFETCQLLIDRGADKNYGDRWTKNAWHQFKSSSISTPSIFHRSRMETLFRPPRTFWFKDDTDEED